MDKHEDQHYISAQTLLQIWITRSYAVKFCRAIQALDINIFVYKEYYAHI